MNKWHSKPSDVALGSPRQSSLFDQEMTPDAIELRRRWRQVFSGVRWSSCGAAPGGGHVVFLLVSLNDAQLLASAKLIL